MMNVFLDDEREPPTGWVRVRWPEDVIFLLNAGVVAALSLDYDLGDDRRDGYQVIQWIEEQVVERGFIPPAVLLCHSANPAGRARMEAGIESIRRLETK